MGAISARFVGTILAGVLRWDRSRAHESEREKPMVDRDLHEGLDHLRQFVAYVYEYLEKKEQGGK